MTIVQLSSTLAGGGAEQMVFHLAKKSHKDIRTIVCSISSVNTLEYLFDNEGIKCHFFNVTSFKNKTLFAGLGKLHALIKDLDDTVIHCHQFHGGLFGVLYKLFFAPKAKLVFTLHTTKVESLGRRINMFLLKPFRKKDIIFSENTKAWYLKNNAVIPNGIDFGQFREISPETNTDKPFRFLFLGRITGVKNPYQMIEASKYFLDQGISDFVIDAVGDGDMKDEIEQAIKKENLTKHIILHGFRTDAKKFLENSNCIILPSFREGMPMVLVEAAAIKLPIIATPVGSIPEILNNSNGFVCDLKDFNETMLHVYKNFAEAYGKSSILYEKVKDEYDIESVYNKHLEIYQDCLK